MVNYLSHKACGTACLQELDMDLPALWSDLGWYYILSKASSSSLPPSHLCETPTFTYIHLALHPT